jgi:hypothetical protein
MDKEQKLAYQKEYYEKNKEKINEKRNKKRKEERREIREKQKKYYEDNKDKIEEVNNNYREEYMKKFYEYCPDYELKVNKIRELRRDDKIEEWEEEGKKLMKLRDEIALKIDNEIKSKYFK